MAATSCCGNILLQIYCTLMQNVCALCKLKYKYRHGPALVNMYHIKYKDYVNNCVHLCSMMTSTPGCVCSYDNTMSVVIGFLHSLR